jgi:hypothetical protein
MSLGGPPALPANPKRIGSGAQQFNVARGNQALRVKCAPVGASGKHIFEQRIAPYFWQRDQPNPGERPSIDVLARFSFRKKDDVCTVTAFGGRKR